MIISLDINRYVVLPYQVIYVCTESDGNSGQGGADGGHARQEVRLERLGTGDLIPFPVQF